MQVTASRPFSRARSLDLFLLGEEILMLCVAEREGPGSILATDHEGQAAEAGHNRHQPGRAVVVLARRHGRLPFAKIETGLGACAHDSDLAERGVRVMRRK